MQNELKIHVFRGIAVQTPIGPAKTPAKTPAAPKQLHHSAWNKHSDHVSNSQTLEKRVTKHQKTRYGPNEVRPKCSLSQTCFNSRSSVSSTWRPVHSTRLSVWWRVSPLFAWPENSSYWHESCVRKTEQNRTELLPRDVSCASFCLWCELLSRLLDEGIIAKI